MSKLQTIFNKQDELRDVALDKGEKVHSILEAFRKSGIITDEDLDTLVAFFITMEAYADALQLPLLQRWAGTETHYFSKLQCIRADV